MGGRGICGGVGWLRPFYTNQTKTNAICGVFACLYNMRRRMFDVQQDEAESQVFMTFANMPKTVLLAAFLPLYTTCCRRMFHVQQHDACHKCSCHFASMPKTLLFTAMLPLYTTCVSLNTSTAGSGAFSWIPKRTSRIAWGNVLA